MNSANRLAAENAATPTTAQSATCHPPIWEVCAVTEVVESDLVGATTMGEVTVVTWVVVAVTVDVTVLVVDAIVDVSKPWVHIT
jgi:hypothetical protein